MPLSRKSSSSPFITNKSLVFSNNDNSTIGIDQHWALIEGVLNIEILNFMEYLPYDPVIKGASIPKNSIAYQSPKSMKNDVIFDGSLSKPFMQSKLMMFFR